MNSFDDRGRRAAPARPSDGTVDVPSACPACRSDAITTTSKTPSIESYWRCNSCGEIWNGSRTMTGRHGAERWR